MAAASKPFAVFEEQVRKSSDASRQLSIFHGQSAVQDGTGTYGANAKATKANNVVAH
jgi:hypothetical protein